MTAPSTATTLACTHCAREFPREALHEVRGSKSRLKRYCAPCFERYRRYVESWKRIHASWSMKPTDEAAWIRSVARAATDRAG
jgi:hypothetical protein